ncbi:MAG: HAMP domain-containing histidine kinase [Syntrophomonadaceae bacterium]|nr:HAMP domain-containing histidine kinase [Syntrophomonadaceae bacterium]
MTLLIYFITNLHRDRFTSFFLQPNYREESPRDLDCRTQQINMVGQLGVAVGHEIRNPLTTVRGFLQLMDDEADPQDLREYFSIMIEEIDKADAAISNLINLSENKTNYREEQDINDIIKECLNNNPPSGHGIKIKSRLHKIPKLQLDKLEIKELVLNLLTNAIESMPHGGTIVIVTKQVAHEVWFIIRDQGTGISKQTAQHIGTPFFSTKEKAHGLGLAICYSIAQRHGARIEFASSPKGTRFIVRFPLHTTSQTLAFDTKSSDLKAVSRLKQGSM